MLASYDKQVLPDGAIVEMKIWQLTKPVRGSAHKLKYSLLDGFPGKRLVAYDNEPGKGDHFEGEETAYNFRGVEKLMADFLADVRRLRVETLAASGLLQRQDGGVSAPYDAITAEMRLE